MAYENINVASAKNHLNNCLNSLDITKSKKIIDDIKDINIWNARSKETFSKSLNVLINQRYVELKNTINGYLKTLDLIGQYQTLQSRNKTYSQSKSNKESQLSSYIRQYDNLEDKESNDAANLRSNISRLRNEISDLTSKINYNISIMSNLRKNISG